MPALTLNESAPRLDRLQLAAIAGLMLVGLAFVYSATFASFLSRPSDELRLGINFWKPLGMMVLPFLLIMKEPDLGSALVLLPTGFAMMYAAGTPRRFLLRLLGLAGAVAALFLADVLFVTNAKWRIPLHSY